MFLCYERITGEVIIIIIMKMMKIIIIMLGKMNSIIFFPLSQRLAQKHNFFFLFLLYEVTFNAIHVHLFCAALLENNYDL